MKTFIKNKKHTNSKGDFLKMKILLTLAILFIIAGCVQTPAPVPEDQTLLDQDDDSDRQTTDFDQEQTDFDQQTTDSDTDDVEFIIRCSTTGSVLSWCAPQSEWVCPEIDHHIFCADPRAIDPEVCEKEEVYIEWLEQNCPNIDVIDWT